MGKTSFMLQCLRVAANYGNRVLAFSLEMTAEQLCVKMLANDISPQRINSGNISFAELSQISNNTTKLLNEDIIIDDTSGLNVDQIIAISEKINLEKKVDIIFIDYLQLIAYDQSKENSELSKITKALKSLAKRLKVPVVCLSQLSRKVEDRADKRPMMSDLRGSGAIEQDADMVMFLYRDSYYSRNTDDMSIELIFGKYRNGGIGTIDLTRNRFFTKFEG